MQNTNHVILIGRLTKTVGEDERSFGYLQNGTCKAEFSIAVNGRGKKNPDGSYSDDVSYFDISLDDYAPVDFNITAIYSDEIDQIDVENDSQMKKSL